MDQAGDGLHQQGGMLVGETSLGSAISSAFPCIMKIIFEFQKLYLSIILNLSDGDGGVPRYQLDEGLSSLVRLLEPVETAKYDFLGLPIHEEWGAIVKESASPAKYSTITKGDLYKTLLILPHHSIVHDETSDILRLDQMRLNTRATISLPGNIIPLLRDSSCYGLTIKGAYNGFYGPNLVFTFLVPNKSTGDILAWRKNAILSPAIEEFLQFVNEQIQGS